MKKRFMIILLLVIIIIPLGYAIILSITKLKLKYTMLEALEHSSLQVIKTNVASIIWIEEVEVIIEGKYFDIESYVISGDNILLRGLYDEKEKELSEQVEKFYTTSTNNTSSRQIHALVVLLQPLILHDTALFCGATSFNTSGSFAFRRDNFFSRKDLVDTPPPKFAGDTYIQ
jgi:hypothetical protein